VARGHVYRVAAMDCDWSQVLSSHSSNTMTAHFCVEALESAPSRYGTAEIFSSDHGGRLTSPAVAEVLEAAGVAIRMDGLGR